jgi:hypothetical protein
MENDLGISGVIFLSASARLLRRNLLVDPKVLLDFGYAREKVVNFFCKPGIARAQLFQPFNAAVNHRNLGSHVAQAIMSCSELFVGVFELVNHFRSEIGDVTLEFASDGFKVLFGHHVLRDMREHFADFPERRLLCHMSQVYHTAY